MNYLNSMSFKTTIMYSSYRFYTKIQKIKNYELGTYLVY